MQFVGYKHVLMFVNCTQDVLQYTVP